MTSAVVLLLALAMTAVGGYLLAEQLRLFEPQFAVHERGCVLITGTSSGLGRDMVFHVLERAPAGVSVIASVRRQSDGDSLSAEAAARGLAAERLLVLLLDVGNSSSIAQAVAQLRGLERPVFALVNNAGVSESAALADAARIDAIVDTNVRGLLHLTQQMLPLLAAAGPGARLVNLGSLAGFVAPPRSSVYAASKFAVEGLSDALRVELRQQYNIAVAVVEPGYVASNMCTDPKKCVDHPVVVSQAVYDALFHPQPRSRYPVAAAGPGLPAWLVRLFAKLLPDRLVDVVVANFAKK